MAKVKFNIKTLDKSSGKMFEPSNEFVEVSEAFAKRIKEIMKNKFNAKGYEFEGESDDPEKPESIDRLRVRYKNLTGEDAGKLKKAEPIEAFKDSVAYTVTDEDEELLEEGLEIGQEIEVPLSETDK